MMTNTAFLKQYRETHLELRVMERQLAMCGTTGKPSGAHSCRYDSISRNTNDVTAAAIQMQDGLEATIADLRSELADMDVRFEGLLRRGRNYRDRYILRQYYQLCLTDSQIAEFLDVSTRHANRLRTELLAFLDEPSIMSTPVVVCPTVSC